MNSLTTQDTQKQLQTNLEQMWIYNMNIDWKFGIYQLGVDPFGFEIAQYH